MSVSTEQRRYEVIKVLGKGGFGTVYKARLQASGGFTKEVALKVLNADVEGTEDFVRRLRDEARMLGLLRHRAIVQVDGLVKLEDRWAIVMEYVEGASLREVLAHGPVPPGVSLEICEEVAAALHVAYSRPNPDGGILNLLHRDIKPGNVQITAGGEVKLLDFGVAKAEFTGREAETRSLIFGSLHYMAPERMDFEDTHKGDIYALAATLYELTTGKQTTKASINPRKHVKIVQDMHDEHLRDVGDPALAAFLERCFSYEPEDRPDAREFERELRNLRQRWPQPWLRDWAETNVPLFVEGRDTTDNIVDDWSGSVIVENTGAMAQPTLAIGKGAFDTLETVPSEHPILEATRSTIQEPPKPPKRVRRSPRQKTKKGSAMRWIIAVLLTVIVIIVLIVAVPTLLAGGGLFALVYQSGIVGEAMDEAYVETTIEDMVKLEALTIGSTPADANQQIVLDAIHRVSDPDNIPNVDFLPMVYFGQRVEKSLEDGIITDIEASEIDIKSKQVTKPK
ncbi:MAG: serine/threonine protein kinase [Kiritimatiellia bacterium]|jgi:serine/threonine protein kinase